MQRLRLQGQRLAQRVNLYLALGGNFDGKADLRSAGP